MGAETGTLVDIISICTATAWMVKWKVQRIEILPGGHNRGKVFIVRVYRGRKSRFNQPTSESNRVGSL